MAKHVSVGENVSFKLSNGDPETDQSDSEQGGSIPVTPDSSNGCRVNSESETEQKEDVNTQILQLVRQMKVAFEQQTDQESTENEEEQAETSDTELNVPNKACQSTVPKISVKPPKFDGSSDWEAFWCQFENWVTLNGYDEDTSGSLLGCCLEGAAQIFYSGIPRDDRKNYARLVELLTARYGGKQAVEIHKAHLNGRVRKPHESIASLRDDIWGLVRKAYPTLGRQAQEAWALDALLRAVDFELRVRCVDQGCHTLDDAVAVMERYEALLEADPKTKRKQVRGIEKCHDNVAEGSMHQTKALSDERLKKIENMLTKLVELTEKRQNYPRRKQNREADESVICYNCQGQGHYARTCPEADKNSKKQGNGKPLTGH